MILTKLPCSTGHTVHILPSVMSALVFQPTALHRWFLHPSLNFCSLPFLSGSIRMLLCKEQSFWFPQVYCFITICQVSISSLSLHSLSKKEASKSYIHFRLLLQMWTMSTTSCFSHKHKWQNTSLQYQIKNICGKSEEKHEHLPACLNKYYLCNSGCHKISCLDLVIYCETPSYQCGSRNLKCFGACGKSSTVRH